MNERDRDNLEFLLSVDARGLEQWYNATDDDDHDYADSLLKAYADQLRERAIELQLSDMNNLYTDALQVLDQFI